VLIGDLTHGRREVGWANEQASYGQMAMSPRESNRFADRRSFPESPVRRM